MRRTEREDEETAAARRMAHLTAICQRCGDAGWWINDTGIHYCDCAAGIKAQEEDEGGD
jgi:hypothetical protein